jgi:hypothetical protein
VPRQLTIKSVKCIKPSSGIDGTVSKIFGEIGKIIAKYSLSTNESDGGIPIGVLAPRLGEIGGVGFLALLDSLFAGDDDLYIKVNNKKIWPGGREEDIGKGETKDINYTATYDGDIKIELMEYDSMSGDDLLGHLTIYPTHTSGDYEYIVGNEGEASLYEIHIRIV